MLLYGCFQPTIYSYPPQRCMPTQVMLIRVVLPPLVAYRFYTTSLGTVAYLMAEALTPLHAYSPRLVFGWTDNSKYGHPSCDHVIRR